MTIVYHDTWETEKGLKDAKRHQEKIDEAIRKNVRDVIGNENIITEKGKKKVRVSVKGLKDYQFIYENTGKGGSGAGQGDGKAGDVIARRQKDGGGGAGLGHGDDMEAEVDIDYLLDVMFEDLGLPWLDPKKKNSIEIPKGWKFESISKKGVYSRIHKKRTMKEAIKRGILFIKEIIENTKLKDMDFEEAQEIAGKALQQSKGDIEKAIEIVNNDEVNGDEPTGFVIHDDDLRYKQIKEDVEICSKAVVFALMDVSGSMTPDKKYLMKSLLFWMVSWLRKQYEFVEIRFIQHTEIATEVDENTFFYGGESGGTLASSAFDKANYIIDTEYPVDEWNIYTIYCSDGGDFEPARAISSIEDMLRKKINMLSYVEIKPYNDFMDNNIQYQYEYSTLLPEVLKTWNFTESTIAGTGDNKGKFWINNDLRFLLSVIRDKSHIWQCLKHMLGINHPERTEE
jgi:sporulation protein YhbH